MEESHWGRGRFRVGRLRPPRDSVLKRSRAARVLLFRGVAAQTDHPTDDELKAGATNRYPYKEMPELVVAVIHQRVFEAFWNDGETFPSRVVVDDVLN